MTSEKESGEKSVGANEAVGTDWYTNPNSSLLKNWAEQDYAEVSGIGSEEANVHHDMDGL
jgi:hypothetical protein